VAYQNEELPMNASSFPKEAEKFEIQRYRRPKDILRLKKTHVPFSGSPRRDPRSPDSILLIPDPYCSHAFYFQFNTHDVSFAEELPNIVASDGQTVTMARLWIRKQALGKQILPFIVDDTRSR
jgi:inorganic pyrophosphatase